MNEKLTQYAHPEVLVSTAWLADHLHDPGIRIVESNEDVLLYGTGHIPGAVHIDWREDLQDPLIRDYISPVVFYGDKANWWACYALWAFRLFGHTNVKLVNGGRDKWIVEGGALTKERSAVPRVSYPVPTRRDLEIRAFYEDTLAHMRAGLPMIDVRSPGEYKGDVTHMPEYPQEGVLRGGHIPGAKSVPWKTAVNEDATFKSPAELQKIYGENCALLPDRDIIAYCRIGERSSHTWFVLTYLLGYEKVRNYDGSWTEWGNKVRAPIERG
jgi:thiosulfate/3-mercaptopyruvate sulfurtransferase